MSPPRALRPETSLLPPNTSPDVPVASLEKQEIGRTLLHVLSPHPKRRLRTEEELKWRTEEERRTLELRSGRLNEERLLIERWSFDLKRNDLQCQRMKKNNAGPEELEENQMVKLES
ncbi:hypothetical protein CMV_011732 [Castanea mollissima]|uniref:Uncharacterized protein n=1 Tax=Castanea mollissima TaxID=60419 RepID=A0A8J4VNX4_9ROSI|nr:hypothetical protein CMV_011732 [Castanea mollissima]